MTHSTLVRCSFAGVLAAAALSFSAPSAAAQKAHAAAGDRDTQTLANYRLTEAGLRKYYKVMGNLAKAAMKDSSTEDAFDSISSDDDADIATMAAKYDRV